MKLSPQDVTVPLVDLSAQHQAMQTEINTAIARVLASSRFIGGPEVQRFEAEFASYCDCRCAVGVASGTAAIELTLRALDIGPGDEVITTPFTFFATAEAIIQTGASVVFADIDPDTYNLDPAAVQQVVSPRSRAILPVHLYGRPAALGGLRTLAKNHGLALIEDAAQAHGARYHGQRTGSMGVAGCFSFFPSKNLGALGDAAADLGARIAVGREAVAVRVAQASHAATGAGVAHRRGTAAVVVADAAHTHALSRVAHRRSSGAGRAVGRRALAASAGRLTRRRRSAAVGVRGAALAGLGRGVAHRRGAAAVRVREAPHAHAAAHVAHRSGARAGRAVRRRALAAGTRRLTRRRGAAAL